MVVVFRSAATWVPKMRERSYNQDLDRVAKSLPSLAHYVDVPVHERGRSFPGGVLALREPPSDRAPPSSPARGGGGDARDAPAGDAKYKNYRDVAAACQNVVAVRRSSASHPSCAFRRRLSAQVWRSRRRPRRRRDRRRMRRVRTS